MTDDALLQRLTQFREPLIDVIQKQLHLVIQSGFLLEQGDAYVPNPVQTDQQRAQTLIETRKAGMLSVKLLESRPGYVGIGMASRPSAPLLPRPLALERATADRIRPPQTSSAPLSSCGGVTPAFLSARVKAATVGHEPSGLARPPCDAAKQTTVLLPTPASSAIATNLAAPAGSKPPTTTCISCGNSDNPLVRCTNPDCGKSFHPTCVPAAATQDGSLCPPCRRRVVLVPRPSQQKGKDKSTPTSLAGAPDGAYEVIDGKVKHSLAIRDNRYYAGDLHGLLDALSDGNGSALESLASPQGSAAQRSSTLASHITGGLLSLLSTRANVVVAVIDVPMSRDSRQVRLSAQPARWFLPAHARSSGIPVIIIAIAWRDRLQLTRGAEFIARLDHSWSSSPAKPAPWASSAAALRGAPDLNASQALTPALTTPQLRRSPLAGSPTRLHVRPSPMPSPAAPPAAAPPAAGPSASFPMPLSDPQPCRPVVSSAEKTPRASAAPRASVRLRASPGATDGASGGMRSNSAQPFAGVPTAASAVPPAPVVLAASVGASRSRIEKAGLMGRRPHSTQHPVTASPSHIPAASVAAAPPPAPPPRPAPAAQNPAEPSGAAPSQRK